MTLLTGLEKYNATPEGGAALVDARYHPESLQQQLPASTTAPGKQHGRMRLHQMHTFANQNEQLRAC